MIKVNMSEATARFSELVEAVSERGEVVVLCRKGVPVAQIKPLPRDKFNRLKVDPQLQVKFAPGFDPTEQATEEDWPESAR